VTIHGKRYAISDGDRAGDPKINDEVGRSTRWRGSVRCWDGGQRWGK
jgi:hypothetical protein